MTDIIERLSREADAWYAGGGGIAALLCEAKLEIEALRKHGPEMQRGTHADGSPWIGTMRDVLEDCKTAASVEAGLRREAQAEIEALRKDAARWRWLRDSPRADVRIIGVGKREGATLDAAIDAAMEKP